MGESFRSDGFLGASRIERKARRDGRMTGTRMTEGKDARMTDLSTTYLGLSLRSPLVVSSSSLTDSVEKIKSYEENGAGAVVLKSIFEEQINKEAEDMDAALEQGSHSFPEAAGSYFANIPMEIGPQEYVRLVESAKKGVKIPVIASVNCVSASSWTKYAKHLESAGADALELNLYYLPTDPAKTSADIEKIYVDIVQQVRAQVKLPIAVKLGPFLTSIPHTVAQVAKAGAQGVVLFNRFYQPNFDIDELKIASQLQLSRPDDMLLPMRWIAILNGRVNVDFAATSGIHDGRGALKVILAGAKVAQVASAIYKHKAPHLKVMLREMEAWLKEKDYATLAETRGILSQKNIEDPDAFERAQYIKVLVGHG
jgi:dihydroorotate dehydrogenase (fumarate)